MIKIAKYKFDTEKQAKKKIQQLGVAEDEEGNEYPTHNHTIVHIGRIVEQEGEYNENGEVVKEPILSEGYHIDVLWVDLEDHPRGWKKYNVDLTHNGVHVFAGIDYLAHKF